MSALRHAASLLTVAAAVLALTACSGSGGNNTAQTQLPDPATDTHAVPARGDRLVSASIGDATTLIPMLAGDSASQDVAGQVYLPLLKYDKNLNLIGQLAQSWDISKDNLTLIFHLRPGLTWTDGVAFTSADCMFTLKLMQDPHTQSPFKSDYDKIVRYRDTYIGLCGSAAHQLVFESLLAKHGDLDFAHKSAIFETFRKLHPILKEQHYLNPKEEEDDPYESTQITALIANGNGIFGVFSMREVFEYTQFWAAGSGREFALGAMQARYRQLRAAEAVGQVDSRLDTVVDWQEPNRKGVVAYLDDQRRPRGYLLWNVWDALETARERIRAGKPVNEAALV